MPKNFSTQLSGQIGESLVVSELGRRGIVATAFAGNVPDIDLLAYKNGVSTAIQVKAQKTGSISVNAEHFLTLKFNGDVQSVVGISQEIDRSLVFVIVFVGNKCGEDEFYVCEQGYIQDIICKNHSSFLKKHNGIRPRQPKSTHCSYYKSDIAEMKDNWALIESRLDSSSRV